MEQVGKVPVISSAGVTQKNIITALSSGNYKIIAQRNDKKTEAEVTLLKKDQAELIPTKTTINHLYCTSRKDASIVFLFGNNVAYPVTVYLTSTTGKVYSATTNTVGEPATITGLEEGNYTPKYGNSCGNSENYSPLKIQNYTATQITRVYAEAPNLKGKTKCKGLQANFL